MKRTHRAKDTSESTPSTPEAPPPSEAPAVRGRPGRRSVEERRHAVLELISGKAGIDQLAQQFGVLPSTIEAWRDEALDGITEALRRGTAKSPREAELERENVDLREALVESTMKVTLLQRAAGIHGARPTRPARSRR
jgi:transposase-like protein